MHAHMRTHAEMYPEAHTVTRVHAHTHTIKVVISVKYAVKEQDKKVPFSKQAADLSL